MTDDNHFFDRDAYLAQQAEAKRERDELLAYVQSLGYATFSAMPKDAIEKDATEYAAREFAKYDSPELSDIELWERYYDIDSPEVRALFDERLVLKRGGIEVEQLWNDHRLDPEAAVKAMYAEEAAGMRSPAPKQPLDLNDSTLAPVWRTPDAEANAAKMMAIILDELYTRVALKKHLYAKRCGALRAGQMHEYFEREAEQRRQARRAMNLATPVTIEGQLLPRY